MSNMTLLLKVSPRECLMTKISQGEAFTTHPGLVHATEGNILACEFNFMDLKNYVEVHYQHTEIGA